MPRCLQYVKDFLAEPLSTAFKHTTLIEVGSGGGRPARPEPEVQSDI